MTHFSVIAAPSILGLKPSGVEMLPAALKQSGLIEGLQAGDGGASRRPPITQKEIPPPCC